MNLSKIFKNKISPLVAIGTVILAVILAGGILVWQGGLENQKDKVAIVTDKAEYDQGKIVEVTIKNNLNKSIWYVLDCGEEPLDVLKYEDEEWEQIHQWQLAKCPAIPFIEEIRLGETKEIKYNGIWEGLFATEGRYKIGLKYNLTEPENGKLKEAEIIYSNEFRIKEKEVDTSKTGSMLETIMGYIKRNHLDAAAFIEEEMSWTRSNMDIRPGYSRYVYTSNAWTVTIGYGISPKNIREHMYEVKAEYKEKIVWKGTIKDGVILERSYMQK